MKRWIALLLALAMVMTLSACGSDRAARACHRLIGRIGTVTLESEEAIRAAEAAFAALTPQEQARIADSGQRLAESRREYDTLKAAFDRQNRLETANAAIAAIGEVTLTSGQAVAAAETAYAALEDEEKWMLGQTAATLQAAVATYEDLVATEEAADTTAAIAAIGEVTLENGRAVDEAARMYDALSDKARAKVTNALTLSQAEKLLAALREAETERILAEYAPRFRVETEGELRWYMPGQMPAHIDSRSYLLPYMGLRGGQPWLCIRYNYTGDTWVFWERLEIVADGQVYTRKLGAFGPTRQSSDTAVWEYYDEMLSYGQGLDTEPLAMLQRIAGSRETTLRFIGDDFSYELTLDQADKDMIADMLALYGALIGIQ